MNVIHERISHPSQSYRVLRLDLEEFRGRRHRHRQVELTWIEEGTGLRCVGDSVEPYGPGDLVFLGPDVPHAWLGTKRQGSARQVATVLQFAPDLFRDDALPEMAATSSLVDFARRGLRIRGAAQGTITRALARLLCENGLLALAILVQILGELVEHREDLEPIASAAFRVGIPNGRDPGRQVARVIDWVHRNLARELTVESAARLVHISPAAFSRYFRREVGTTFSQYLNDARCSQACLRLRASDKPVSLVAQECGYATLSHFNRQFRRKTGRTPRDFRRG